MRLEELPFASASATELYPSIPPSLGQEREDALYAMYSKGQFPNWLRVVHEVPVEHTREDGTVLRGAFYCLPDLLCVGNDADYLYTPMGAIGAERVLRLLGCRLPTPKMVKDIYLQTAFPQVAQPWGPPYDHSMYLTSRWPAQTRRVRANMNSSGARPGDLVAGHFKNVTVSEKLVGCHGSELSFYGWFKSNGEPIQGDSMAHGAGYCDYSHGVRGVLPEVAVERDLVPLDRALGDPEVAELFTWNGAFHPTTYAANREAGGVSGVRYH